jgi:hypothetical protein
MFSTLYIDEGNMLNFYDTREEAEARVLALVNKHPEIAEEYGMIELETHGRGVGEFVSGAELQARDKRSQA